VKLPASCRVFLIGLLLISVGVAAQNSTSPSQASGAKSSTKKPATSESQEGEMRFQTHCGRCHVPPDDLSPREARAVVRQMRVRANLTAEDERLILKFLAP
jgi:hypothetical protein